VTKKIDNSAAFVSDLISEIISSCTNVSKQIQDRLFEWAKFITREDPCDVTETSGRKMLMQYQDLIEKLHVLKGAPVLSDIITIGSLFEVEIAYEDGSRKNQCNFVLPICQFPDESLTLAGYTKEKIKFQKNYKLNSVSVNLLLSNSFFVGKKLHDRFHSAGGPQLEQINKETWTPTGSQIVGATFRITHVYK
jgi:hypothetical protein